MERIELIVFWICFNFIFFNLYICYVFLYLYMFIFCSIFIFNILLLGLSRINRSEVVLYLRARSISYRF